MNSGSDTPQAARQWYIQVDGQAYGPFDDRTLWSYMIEGRVSAQSLVSQSANMGYRLVSSDPGLMNWLAQATDRPTQQRQAPDVAPCLLYTSPSPRHATLSRMPSSA